MITLVVRGGQEMLESVCHGQETVMIGTIVEKVELCKINKCINVKAAEACHLSSDQQCSVSYYCCLKG